MESSTKKKLGTATGGVTVVAAAVALTAGSFAYFQDTETDTGTASAGTLEIGESDITNVDLSNMAPGDQRSFTYEVTNEGSVSGDLTLGVEHHGGNTALRDALQVQVGSLSSNSLTAYEKQGPASFGTVAPGETKDIDVTVSLPETGENQNALQGTDVSAKLTTTLTHEGES